MNGPQPHVGFIDSLGPPPGSTPLPPQPYLNGLEDPFNAHGSLPGSAPLQPQLHFNPLDDPFKAHSELNGFAIPPDGLANGDSRARIMSPFSTDSHELNLMRQKSPVGLLSPRTSQTGPLPLNERIHSLGLGRRRSNVADQAKDVFWKQNLLGKPPLLLLPVDKPRTAASSLADALQVPVALPAQLSAELTVLAQQLRSDLHHLLLAAFKVLLMRYSRQDDLTLGCAAQGPLESVSHALRARQAF